MRQRPGGRANALPRADGGRVSAAILPGEMTGRSLPERLEATLTLTREVREAGVPLLLAMSDAAVYRGGGRVNEAGEIGGRTREGMEASILQMALLGAARGLMGDAVRTMLVRHAPVLVKTARRGATRCWRGGRSGCAILRRAGVCASAGCRLLRADAGRAGVSMRRGAAYTTSGRMSGASAHARARHGGWQCATAARARRRKKRRTASPGAASGWKRGAAALRRGLSTGRGSGAGSALRAASCGAGGAGGGGHPPDDADISGRLPRIT